MHAHLILHAQKASGTRLDIQYLRMIKIIGKSASHSVSKFNADCHNQITAFYKFFNFWLASSTDI
ncbi:hypothetical protein D3C84_993450 [compost metagenome]